VSFWPTAQLDFQQSELIDMQVETRLQSTAQRNGQTIDASIYNKYAPIALAETIFIRSEMACVNAIQSKGKDSSTQGILPPSLIRNRSGVHSFARR